MSSAEEWIGGSDFEVYGVKIPAHVLQGAVSYAKDWAVSHGLTMRLSESVTSSERVGYAPVMLFPSPVPDHVFTQLAAVQTLWNTLMHRISRDHDFLESIFTEVIEHDDYTRRMWWVYNTTHSEGTNGDIALGLFRSDYMVQARDGSMCPKQVEFNTMAASFGGLSEKMPNFHRSVLKYLDLPHSGIQPNSSLDGLVSGMMRAWRQYGSTSAVVLFLIEPVSQNAVDQRLHEFLLLEKYGIKSLRYSLTEVADLGHLRSEDKALIVDGHEICLTYSRCGYAPQHFPTENEWEARLMIERSCAFKCPSMAYQLAGTKRIQQTLTRPGMVEKFLDDKQSAQIRLNFAELWLLNDDSEGEKAAQMAYAAPHKYVLKPEREGGGNNMYGEEIVSTLKQLEGNPDRSKYILMEKIEPVSMRNIILRPGDPPRVCETIGELGFFGCFMGSRSGTDELFNEQIGYLLRSKSVDKNDGGVAAGNAVLDTPLLTEG